MKPISEKLKLNAVQFAEKVSSYRYHKISNGIAFKALKEISREKGKLAARTKKLAYEYAVDALGWKGYAPWLYVYSHVSGEFREGWLPDNFYGKVVIPKIQGEYGKISFLKSLNNRLFENEISPDLAYFINGFWFEKDFKPISREHVKNILFSDTQKVVCKLDHSYQGLGVLVYEKKDFDPDSIVKKGNGVIQKHIQQHPFFNSFIPGAVATIRITTVVDTNSKMSLRSCYLRLGRSGDTHVQSINHVRVPIYMKDGMLYEQGYLANWKEISNHPDTHEAFSNKIIPNYKACAELVLQLHKKMPMVCSIGWDVIVDHTNNPVVMEWNGYSNDIKFSEATQGPCFKDLGWHLLVR